MINVIDIAYCTDISTVRKRRPFGVSPKTPFTTSAGANEVL